MEGLKRALGRNVRRQRAKRRLTQEELSERAGIHYTFLGHIERGTKVPSLYTLVRLSHALAVPVGRLLRGVDGQPE